MAKHVFVLFHSIDHSKGIASCKTLAENKDLAESYGRKAKKLGNTGYALFAEHVDPRVVAGLSWLRLPERRKRVPKCMQAFARQFPPSPPFRRHRTDPDTLQRPLIIHWTPPSNTPPA